MERLLNKRSKKDAEIEEYLDWIKIEAIPQDVKNFFEFDQIINYETLVDFTLKFSDNVIIE